MPENLTKRHKGRLDLGHNLLVIQKMLLRQTAGSKE